MLFLLIRKFQTPRYVQIQRGISLQTSKDVCMYPVSALSSTLLYNVRTFYKVKQQVRGPIFYHMASFGVMFPTAYQLYLESDGNHYDVFLAS